MLSVEVQNNIEVIVEVEKLDINNANEVFKKLKEIANLYHKDLDKDLELNLEKVSIIDSSAIAMFIKFIQFLSGSNRELILTNVPSHFVDIFNKIKLSKFLKIK